MSQSEDELAFKAAVEEITKKFTAKIPGHLQDIKQLRLGLEAHLQNLNPQDPAFLDLFADLLKKSHSLAGSAGQFGHDDLTELARGVEEMCLSIEAAHFSNHDAFSLLLEFIIELESYKI